jgi:hypothetical protein
VVFGLGSWIGGRNLGWEALREEWIYMGVYG